MKNPKPKTKEETRIEEDESGTVIVCSCGNRFHIQKARDKDYQRAYSQAKQEVLEEVMKIYGEEDKKFGDNYGYWKMWRTFKQKLEELK